MANRIVTDEQRSSKRMTHRRHLITLVVLMGMAIAAYATVLVIMSVEGKW